MEKDGEQPTKPSTKKKDATPPERTLPVEEELRPRTPKAKTRREHAREYQKQYRQKMKTHMESLRSNQIRGAYLLVVNNNGELDEGEINTEDEYITTLAGFMTTLKNKGAIMDYKLTKKPLTNDSRMIVGEEPILDTQSVQSMKDYWGPRFG